MLLISNVIFFYQQFWVIHNHPVVWDHIIKLLYCKLVAVGQGTGVAVALTRSACAVVYPKQRQYRCCLEAVAVCIFYQ